MHENVRANNIKLRQVKRLLGLEEIFSERRPQKPACVISRSMQEQHCIVDLTRVITVRRTECEIVKPQLGQTFAVMEAKILNGEISVGLSRVTCLYLIGPLRRGSRVLRLRVSDHVIGGCRDCNKRDKDQKESSEAHGFPFPL